MTVAPCRHNAASFSHSHGSQSDQRVPPRKGGGPGSSAVASSRNRARAASIAGSDQRSSRQWSGGSFSSARSQVALSSSNATPRQRQGQPYSTPSRLNAPNRRWTNSSRVGAFLPRKRSAVAARLPVAASCVTRESGTASRSAASPAASLGATSSSRITSGASSTAGSCSASRAASLGQSCPSLGCVATALSGTGVGGPLGAARSERTKLPHSAAPTAPPPATTTTIPAPSSARRPRRRVSGARVGRSLMRRRFPVLETRPAAR